MGMVAYLHQLDVRFAQQLLDEPNRVHDFLDDFAADELAEDAQGEAIDLDKAWHGLHFLLTGTAWDGQEPFSYLITGGTDVGNETEHDVGYGPARILAPAQVAAFNEATAILTSSEMQKRCDWREMTRLEIYPEVWEREGQDEKDNSDYLNEYAIDLQSFLSRAVAQQKAIMIYLA